MSFCCFWSVAQQQFENQICHTIFLLVYRSSLKRREFPRFITFESSERTVISVAKSSWSFSNSRVCKRKLSLHKGAVNKGQNACREIDFFQSLREMAGKGAFLKINTHIKLLREQSRFRL